MDYSCHHLVCLMMQELNRKLKLDKKKDFLKFFSKETVQLQSSTTGRGQEQSWVQRRDRQIEGKYATFRHNLEAAQVSHGNCRLPKAGRDQGKGYFIQIKPCFLVLKGFLFIPPW